MWTRRDLLLQRGCRDGDLRLDISLFFRFVHTYRHDSVIGQDVLTGWLSVVELQVCLRYFTAVFLQARNWTAVGVEGREESLPHLRTRLDTYLLVLPAGTLARSVALEAIVWRQIQVLRVLVAIIRDRQVLLNLLLQKLLLVLRMLLKIEVLHDLLNCIIDFGFVRGSLLDVVQVQALQQQRRVLLQPYLLAWRLDQSQVALDSISARSELAEGQETIN